MGGSNPNIKCRKLTAIQVYESHVCHSHSWVQMQTDTDTDTGLKFKF